jgi:hypothetical protein
VSELAPPDARPPAWLATPRGGALRPARDVARRAADRLREGPGPAAEHLQEVAAWAEVDFLGACLTLLDGDGDGGGPGDGDWQEVRRWLSARRESAAAPTGDELLVLHAALVGLARGASGDAFAYAGVRRVGGRPLIECELMAARLSAIATDELVADLQLGCLCEQAATDGDADGREAVQREIRRATLAVVVESAHVHGGHGFVQPDDPARRVELAHALLGRIASRPAPALGA